MVKIRTFFVCLIVVNCDKILSLRNQEQTDWAMNRTVRISRKFAMSDHIKIIMDISLFWSMGGWKVSHGTISWCCNSIQEANIIFNRTCSMKLPWTKHIKWYSRRKIELKFPALCALQSTKCYQTRRTYTNIQHFGISYVGHFSVIWYTITRQLWLFWTIFLFHDIQNEICVSRI